MMALYVAAIMKFEKIGELLIECGADGALQNFKGLTPLDIVKRSAGFMNLLGSEEEIWDCTKE
jgi:hypothetical protein